MAINSTSNSAPILSPDEVNQLLLQPVEATSIAAQVASVLHTSTHALRIPAVAADPQAAWTLEGEEISTSRAQLEEVVAEPRKLAGLTVLSSELVDDSSPAAVELIGQGLTRDISRRIDEAFFAQPGGHAPAGLNGAEVTMLHTQAVSEWPNLDVADEAIYRASAAGAEVSNWIVSPRTLKELGAVKESEGSGRGLLQPDPTQPSARLLAGRPVLVSASVEDNTIWAVDQSQSFLVIRSDVEVEADRSAFFSADSVAVRAIMRIGFAFSNPAGVVRIAADLTEEG